VSPRWSNIILPLTLLTLADKVIPATLLGYLSLIAIFAKTSAIFEGLVQ
jgi:hypothetical protein